MPLILDEPAKGEGLDECLDILGQTPMLRNIYTQICFCYPVVGDSSHASIVDTLTRGLEKLSESFPWVAGQVVNEGAGADNSGVFKIKPFEKTPRLFVNDLRNDSSAPTWDALKAAKFPFSMLDESVIAPRASITLPWSPNAAKPAPVLLLQANFIEGGLLLTIVANHATMDMTGQGQIIDLLSKACRNEPFTSEEVSSGNLTRRNLVPLLDDYTQCPKVARQIMKPAPSPPASNGPHGKTAPSVPQLPSQPTWAYFNFSSTSLSDLKSLATETIANGYVSTDDALTAFIYQSVIRARLPRLDASASPTLARAIDVRPFLNIPAAYPGLMQNMTYHTYKPQDLISEPLGAVASQLRSALLPETSTLAEHTRALATLYDRTPDKRVISFTGTLDLSVDIMVSSWARLNCYELDFGLGLGKPESVRRPRFAARLESLLYLLPKTPNGDIAVAIGLREEDMERLKADEEFAEYGAYVG